MYPKNIPTLKSDLSLGKVKAHTQPNYFIYCVTKLEVIRSSLHFHHPMTSVKNGILVMPQLNTIIFNIITK